MSTAGPTGIERQRVPMLSHINVAPYGLDIPTYRIEIMNNTMGVKFENIDYVELHPIEWDGMLFFSDGKKDSKETFSIYSADIIDLKKASKIKGKILKKTEQVVVITFREANTLVKTENVITIDLEDKYVDDFMNRVQLIRDKASDAEYWIYKVISDLSLMFSSPKEVYIYPKTPFLADYEQLIWYNTNIKQDKKRRIK